MYHEKMLSVSKIENGFLIEVRAPYKLKKKKKDDADDSKVSCCGMDEGTRYTEKELFAKDATDLGNKIETLIPMLEVKEFSGKEAFDSAFAEAIT